MAIQSTAALRRGLMTGALAAALLAAGCGPKAGPADEPKPIAWRVRCWRA